MHSIHRVPLRIHIQSTHVPYNVMSEDFIPYLQGIGLILQREKLFITHVQADLTLYRILQNNRAIYGVEHDHE